MKTLGLFRHAKSDWHDARARDVDRPLNARGIKAAQVMGVYIREHPQQWNKILASPAVRCAQTIEIAAQEAKANLPITWERSIYLASSACLIDLLRELDEGLGAVLMVGHNPGLEDLIFDLVPDDGTSPLRDVVEEKFPTATYAVLELDIDRWEDIADGCARLVHIIRPRDLDAELGPQ